jgi:lactoylglutathione lyase
MTSALTPATLHTGHVGLNVTDVARSTAFYQQIFGLEILVEGQDGERRWAFLGRDRVVMLTLWQQSEGRFATGTPGLHHLSFQVPTLADVEGVRHILRSLGADFQYDGVVPHAEGGDSGGIFFTDPDGIRLEVYTPTGLAASDAAPVGSTPACGFF